MSLERFGRFEVGTYNDENVQLRCDHANGDSRAYEIPFMTYEETEDLIYALRRTLRQIDEHRESMTRMRSKP
mgnify:CR=1 FL=1